MYPSANGAIVTVRMLQSVGLDLTAPSGKWRRFVMFLIVFFQASYFSSSLRFVDVANSLDAGSTRTGIDLVCKTEYAQKIFLASFLFVYK